MPNVFRKRMLVINKKTEGAKTNGEINRIKICAKCLKRAKKFSFIKAADKAVLSNKVIRVVDWEKSSKLPPDGEAGKAQSSKVEEKKKEKVERIEKKKPEVSIEELVGKKK